MEIHTQDYVVKLAFQVQVSSVLASPQLSLLSSLDLPFPQLSSWRYTLQAPFPRSQVSVLLRSIQPELGPSLWSSFLPSPPFFLLSTKCFIFLLPMTFFHHMALSLLSSTGFVSQWFSLLPSSAFSALPLYPKEILLSL